MPISDLLGKRARTASGVEVSAPTVRSFFRALDVFGAEIAAMRSTAHKIEDISWTMPVAEAIAPFVKNTRDGRLEYVLDGLATPAGMDPLGVALAVAERIAPFARRIDRLLSDPDAAFVPADDDEVDQSVLSIIRIAEQYKIDPMTIFDWPLALYVDVWQALSRPARDGTGDGRGGEVLSGMIATDVNPPIVGGATSEEAP
jgi:hypothetical protein